MRRDLELPNTMPAMMVVAALITATGIVTQTAAPTRADTPLQIQSLGEQDCAHVDSANRIEICVPWDGSLVDPSQAADLTAPHWDTDGMRAALAAPVVETIHAYEALFSGVSGTSDRTFRITVEDLPMIGPDSFMYGIVPDDAMDENADCNLSLDGWLQDPATGNYSTNVIPGTASLQLDIQLSVVDHELFHCFQRFLIGSPDTGLPQSRNWLWEGTAMWAEHFRQPNRQSEWGPFDEWVNQAHRPFLQRDHDSGYAYVFGAVNQGLSSAAIRDLLVSAATASDPESIFVGTYLSAIGGPEKWHEVSLAGWNREPATPFTEPGVEIYDPPQFDVIDIEEYDDGTLEHSLPALSRWNQKIHLLPAGNGEQPNRLHLDLSQVSADSNLHVSALVQTLDGWVSPPILLTGVDAVDFCGEEIGPCGEEPPQHERHLVGSVKSVTLIITSVATEATDISIDWDAYNPRLDGRWRRVTADLGPHAPIAVIGTELEFREVDRQFEEQSAQAELLEFETSAHAAIGLAGYAGDDSWDCVMEGAYIVSMRTQYPVIDAANAQGTVGQITPVAELVDWNNDCEYVGVNSHMPEPLDVSGLHIPVAAAGPQRRFNFEIRAEGRELELRLPHRSYVYERIDE